MSSISFPPSSPEHSSPSESKHDSDRRSRTRIDYKALNEGRSLPLNTTMKKDFQKTSTQSESAANRANQSVQRSALRETKLRSDPLVEVHGPFDVTCKRCGTHIKLSTKSTYDPFHWHRHIERCSKRPTKVLKQIREQGKTNERKKRSSFSKSLMSQLALSARSTKLLRSQKRNDAAQGTGHTPDLTPDIDGEALSVAVKEEKSPSPELEYPSSPIQPEESSPPPTTPSATPTRETDMVFEEYLLRSRRKLTREFSPLTVDSWQTWTWSQLKEPVWVIASYPNQEGSNPTTPEKAAEALSAEDLEEIEETNRGVYTHIVRCK